MKSLPLRRWQALVFGGQTGYIPNAWAHEHVHGRDETFIIGTTGRQVGKCGRVSTLLHMADGSRKRFDEVQVGDIALSWDGEKLLPAPVTDVIDNGVQPIYEITTRRGRVTYVTGNHPIWARHAPPVLHITRRGKNYLPNFDWIPAAEIKVGDEIAPMLTYMPEAVEYVSEADGWLLGALVGDGGLTQGSVYFTNDDPLIWSEVASRYELGGKDPITKVLRGALEFARAHDIMGKCAHDKVVPESILKGGPDAWRGFLAGMLDTDGTVDRLVEWYSVSRRLLDDMRMLLHYLGVNSTLSLKNGRYNGESHESWRLTVSGSDNIERLASILKIRGAKAPRLAALAESKKSLKRNNRGLRDFVKSVRVLPAEPTIGISIGGTHTHVTDNMITHNTVAAAIEIDEGMIRPADDYGAPWVGVLAPDYSKAELSVQMYINMLTETFGRESFRVNQNKHELQIIDPAAGTVGARLKWLSAEDEYGVVGFTFSKVIIDEAQGIPDKIWFKFLPTTSIRSAQKVIFGTPDITTDQTWFQGIWLKGQDPLETAYHSYTVASWESGRDAETPWMSTEDILQAKAEMTENEFRRLYGGEWVNEDGQFFTHYDEAFYDGEESFNPMRRYVMSVDLAVEDDYNVVLVGDVSTRKVVFKERWNKTEPIDTYERIHNIWMRWNRPRVMADYTGLGIPMVKELQQRGIPVIPFQWTVQTKMPTLGKLAADLQHGRTRIPKGWDDLKRELRGFLRKRTPSGQITANAASGFTDDIIMSMALLNELFNRSSGGGQKKRRNYLEGSAA